jgi:hypothetical protein
VHYHREIRSFALIPAAVLLISALNCTSANAFETNRVRFLSAGTDVAATDGSGKSGGELSLSMSKASELSLGDLRDVGLCILQLKQQAKNIFLEATRKPLDRASAVELEDPFQISPSNLDANAKYMETRPEWLTFYVGTMEPIIHLFKEDVKDVQSGFEKVVVPKGTKDEFTKIYRDYESAVTQLNEHLSIIYDDIHQPDNNVAVAKEAIKMFELAQNLEKRRQEAFTLIKKAGTTETERINPSEKSAN